MVTGVPSLCRRCSAQVAPLLKHMIPCDQCKLTCGERNGVRGFAASTEPISTNHCRILRAVIGDHDWKLVDADVTIGDGQCNRGCCMCGYDVALLEFMDCQGCRCILEYPVGRLL